jgi:hypothetical protein
MINPRALKSRASLVESREVVCDELSGQRVRENAVHGHRVVQTTYETTAEGVAALVRRVLDLTDDEFRYREVDAPACAEKESIRGLAGAEDRFSNSLGEGLGLGCWSLSAHLATALLDCADRREFPWAFTAVTWKR